MKPTVSVSYAWNRGGFPIGGVEKAYLLVELKGEAAIHSEQAPVNSKEEWMEALAEQEGENLYHIERPDNIPAIFAQELQGLLSVVARHLRMTIRTSDYCRLIGIHGYVAEGGRGEYSASLGDLYGDEVKSLLLEITFEPHPAGERTVLLLDLEYVDVTEGAAIRHEQIEVKATFTKDLTVLETPENPIVIKQVQMMEAAKTITKAMEALDDGDLAGGQKLLKEQADQLLLHAIQSGDAELREESEKLYSQLEHFEILQYNAQTTASAKVPADEASIPGWLIGFCQRSAGDFRRGRIRRSGRS